jgi:hypothetical protein
MSVDGQFGGRITFEFAGGKIKTTGEITLHPTLRKIEAKANGDGSPAYYVTPKLPAAKIKLRHQDGVDYDALLMQKGDCTIVEEDNGRTHMFTGTRMTGEPDVDLANGEVDGLMIEGGQYTRLDT